MTKKQARTIANMLLSIILLMRYPLVSAPHWFNSAAVGYALISFGIAFIRLCNSGGEE